MGGVISKFAFLPPDRASSKRRLPRTDPNLHFIPQPKDKETPEISYLHYRASGGSNGMLGRRTRPRVILWSHGNAEDLSVGKVFFAHVAKHWNIDVIAYDYPGYCWTDGSPNEGSVIKTANAVFDHVVGPLGFQRDEVVLLGRSIGSGPTVDLASRQRGLAGLILLSPLASCAAVVGSVARYGLYPADIFCNARKIHKVDDYPVMIWHGTKDSVIPYAHSKELVEELQNVNSHVEKIWVEGADHNDVEDVFGLDAWIRDVNRFLSKCGTTYPTDCRKAPAAAAASSASAKSSRSSWFCCTSTAADDEEVYHQQHQGRATINQPEASTTRRQSSYDGSTK